MQTKNFLYKVLSMATQLIVSLLFTKLIVDYINEEANGFFVLSNDFVNYATVISIALNSMAIRFITVSYHRDSIDDTDKYFNTLFFGNILLAIVITVPGLVFVANLPKIINIPNALEIDIKIHFLWVLINFIVTIIASVFSIAVLAKNRIDLDSKRTIESNILKAILLISCYNFFAPKLWIAGFVTFLSTIYVIIRNIHYTTLLLPEIHICNIKYFSINHFKILIKSGIWNSFTKIGSILLTGLDLLITNKFISVYFMGLLSIAKILPKYLLSSIGHITTVFNPEILIAYAKNDTQRVINLLKISIKLNSILSIIFNILIIVFGKRFYMLLFPEQDYELIHLLTVLSIAGLAFVMPFEGLWILFTATDKVKISSLYLFIEAFLTISIVFVLIFFFDDKFVRLIIVTSISSFFEIIRGILFLPVSGAYLLRVPMKTFYTSLKKILFAFFISYFISSVINNFFENNSWFLLIIFSFFSIITSFLVCFNIILNQYEKREVINKFLNLLHI